MKGHRLVEEKKGGRRVGRIQTGGSAQASEQVTQANGDEMRGK